MVKPFALTEQFVYNLNNESVQICRHHQWPDLYLASLTSTRYYYRSSLGASALTDAFWVAFRIPNLLRRLFAEGAFSQAFVPILGAYKEQYEEAQVKQLINHVTLILGATLLMVSVLGAIFAPLIVTIMASGIARDGGQAFEAAVWMTRVMFPYIFCMSLVALASGVLNTWRKFAIPAFTPILLNLSMIGAALFLVNYFELPIYALAVGVMIGGVLQLSTQWLALAKIGMLPRPSLNFKKPENSTVRRIITLMGPATIGVSVAQISLLINTNIATWLPGGSVSWLSFADRLMEFPTALLGIALGTVLLPSLAAAHANEDHQRYSHLMDWGLRLICLLGLPCMLGLALLSDGLVASLFNYGAFGIRCKPNSNGCHCLWFWYFGYFSSQNFSPWLLCQTRYSHPSQNRHHRFSTHSNDERCTGALT